MPTKKPTAADATPQIEHTTLPHARRLHLAALAYHQGAAHPDTEYTQRVRDLDLESRLAAFFNGWDALMNARATRQQLVADAECFVLAQMAAERLAKES